MTKTSKNKHEQGGATTIKYESDGTVLWHMRLGHMGKRMMMELHKRDY